MTFAIYFIALNNFLILLNFGRFFNKTGAFIITCFNFCCLLSFIFCVFVDVNIYNSIIKLWMFDWIDLYVLYVKFILLFDPLAIFMLLIIVGISFVVHIYSFDYMSQDPYIIRFIALLSLFTFFMIVLVTSNNLLQLFLGWEGVGIVSFLLISFWFTRKHAVQSALKAVMLNRVGDCGLLFVILLSFILFKTLNFEDIFFLASSFNKFYIDFLGFKFDIITFVTFWLFLGVVGKSAQLGLHVWLPDAMEGPTPVSALLHAATMVTAGVFLLIRMSLVVDFGQNMPQIITFFGVITLFFAGTVGLFQFDIKRIIAYSTCGQLGYMVFSCGMSNYSVSLFHLFNHAFFKALLFLGAGAIIHSLNDEQDIRRMGGLVGLMPLNYISFFWGSVILCGFPFMSGFYSKDLIMEMSYFNEKPWFLLSFIGAVISVMYSFKLIYYVFLNKPQAPEISYKTLHDNSFIVTFCLVFLLLCSYFVGFMFKEFFLGIGSIQFNNMISLNDFMIFKTEFFYNNYFIFSKVFFFLILVIIIYLMFLFYFSKFSQMTFKFYFLLFLKFLLSDKYIMSNKIFYYFWFINFFSKKWYFDNIYNYLSFKGLFLSYKLFRVTDKGFLEIYGPLGIKNFAIIVFNSLKILNSGFIFNYLGFYLFFFPILISFFVYIYLNANFYLLWILFSVILFLVIGIAKFFVDNKEGESWANFGHFHDK